MPSPCFFILSAAALWLIHLILNEPFIWPDLNLTVSILLAGICIGLAYRNWNQSMQYGHLQLLMCMTYFMPVLSAGMSMWLLDVRPVRSFWAGALLVTLGALICWCATSEVDTQSCGVKARR